jgi:tetratricopeptide (TPR) repeat protein
MSLRDQLKKVYGKVAVLVGRTRVKLQPHSLDSRLQLAQAYIQRSAWQPAYELGQQIRQQDPQNAKAYQVLAAVYSGQGLNDPALTAIETAIALDPQVPWFYQDLGKIHLAKERYNEAIAAFEQAVKLDPQVAWFQFNLGEARVKQGDCAAAIAPLQRSIQLNPLFAWSYYYLGEAYLSLAQLDNAINQYRKATLLAPDIDYLQDAFAYASHRQDQEDRIQAFCQRPPTDRPRALLLLPYPPYPPKLGAATRMFYEMKALQAKTDLAVVFFGFVKGDFRIEADLADLSQLAIAVTLGDRPIPAAGLAPAIHRYSSHRMTKLLTALSAANFDLVVIDFIYMAQYRYLFPQAFTVLSEHNVESQILRRCADVQSTQADQTAIDQLEQYEDQLWPQFDLRTVVSQQDQAIVDRRAPNGATIVVNNGINTQTISLFPDNPTPRILFMGTLSYYPNIDGSTYLIQEILPHIWRQNPTIECWIAGSEPPASIYALAQDTRIRIIADPESMEDIAQQCCCTIVPLRIGGGTRIKILHSMAMGLPVVSTSLGSEGLDVIDNQHLLIRDRPADFATATIQLIADASLRQTLRTQGRQLVEQQYDWENIFNHAVDRILAQIR